MRQRRIAIIVCLLSAGLLGVYWVATGQEGRTPWPPPPVKFDPGLVDTPSVPPPVPPSGTMPPATIDKKDRPVHKWVSNVLSGSAADTMKLRACGVGTPDGLQQVGFQENASDIPPPVPAKPTTRPMPSAPDGQSRPIAPVMPDVPGSPNPLLPVLPPPTAKPVKGAPAMPVADPLPLDPTRSAITDPVKKTPAGAKNGRPPAFVLLGSNKQKKPAATPSAPVAQTTPSIPHVDPLPTPVVPQSTQQTVAKSMSTPDAPRLSEVQTPPVTVEKHLIASGQPGGPRVFQIVVRNQGSVPAPQVTVEDDLTADAKIVQAEPMPQLLGTRAAWRFTDLAPGGVRVVNLALQGSPADGPHNTRVHVAAASRPGTLLEPVRPMEPPMPVPSIGVQIAPPASAMTGRPAVFEVTFANTGKVRVTSLLLHAKLSDGLRHPVGQDIEAEIGDLAPGISKTVKITATAVLPGRQGIQVHLKSSAGAEAAAQAAVEVVAAPTGLGVQQAPATRLFVGRTADLRIEITNYSAQPMRQVNIVSYVPDGIDLVAASDHGNYQPSGRTVNWLLDTLPPGYTQALFLRVTATAPGQATHTVAVRAAGIAEVRSTGTLSSEGVADLLVDLHGDHAVEVGRDTVYEVRVGNPGSGPSTNVRVMLELTPGLAPRKAEGPSAYHIEGQRVIFDPVPPLVSQGQSLYRVLVNGQSVGDARVRVSVISDQVQTPVIRETATRVYRD